MDEWSNTTWQWRHRWRMTQDEARAWCNVSLSTWQRWEQGRTEPRAEEARRVLALMLDYEHQRGREIVLASSPAAISPEPRGQWRS